MRHVTTIFGLIAFAVISAGPSTAQFARLPVLLAQSSSGLPVDVQRDIVKQKLVKAFIAQDWAAVVRLARQGRALGGMPPSLDYIEGKALLRTGKPAQARRLLDRYLAKANRQSPNYKAAINARIEADGAIAKAGRARIEEAARRRKAAEAESLRRRQAARAQMKRARRQRAAAAAGNRRRQAVAKLTGKPLPAYRTPNLVTKARGYNCNRTLRKTERISFSRISSCKFRYIVKTEKRYTWSPRGCRVFKSSKTKSYSVSSHSKLINLASTKSNWEYRTVNEWHYVEQDLNNRTVRKWVNGVRRRIKPKRPQWKKIVFTLYRVRFGKWQHFNFNRVQAGGAFFNAAKRATALCRAR